MIVESPRPPKWRTEGTLWGSRDLRDWQPYVIVGQIFIFLFMVVEFGALIPPAIVSVAIAMLGIGVAIIAPPGMVMRIPLSLPILPVPDLVRDVEGVAFDECVDARRARGADDRLDDHRRRAAAAAGDHRAILASLRRRLDDDRRTHHLALHHDQAHLPGQL